MARHHPSAALGRIEAIRVAQRIAARGEAIEALRRERDALAASERAEGEAEQALAAWDRQLSGAGFSPEIARALAAECNRLSAVAASARDAAGAAAAERERCETGWHRCNARCDQAAALLAASRRAEMRRRDEKAIARAEDRVTSLWSLR